MNAKNTLDSCSEAVVRIDEFLCINQKFDSYTRWLNRYSKHPGDHEDPYLFGNLVQSMFSGGFKGEIVDQWMPKMREAFHEWDVIWISKLSDSALQTIVESGNVIANLNKIRSIRNNALTFNQIVKKHSRFGNYLTGFQIIPILAKELTVRFEYIGPVTVQDFLRNIGYNTAKPDRHIIRWLQRMGIPFNPNNTAQIMELIKTIAQATNFKQNRFDSAIYLFCADRNDVLTQGGICGILPKCSYCPINELCARSIENSQNSVKPKKNQTMRKTENPNKSNVVSFLADSVWDSCYRGQTLEEVQETNPFATRGWLMEPIGHNGSRERRGDILTMFSGQSHVDLNRIVNLGRNKGKYAAFRAIVHGHATFSEPLLIRTDSIL